MTIQSFTAQNEPAEHLKTPTSASITFFFLHLWKPTIKNAIFISDSDRENSIFVLDRYKRLNLYVV